MDNFKFPKRPGGMPPLKRPMPIPRRILPPPLGRPIPKSPLIKSSFFYKTPSKTQTSKTFKINPLIIFGVIFLAIVIILVLMLILKPSKISEQDLNLGFSTFLKKGQSLRFELNKEDHELSVSSLKEDSVSLVIQSKKIETTLIVNEAKKLDLDEDGILDLRIRLRDIVDEKANLILKKISESSCIGDWQCSDWSTCENSIQTRSCEDINNCDTEKGKPQEERECNATEYQTSSTNTIDCKENWECFINAAIGCTKASMTEDFSIDFSGILSYTSVFIELKGIKDERCIFYQRTLDAKIEYGEEIIEMLHEMNITDDIIESLEQEENKESQKIIGLEHTCYFIPERLAEMLQRWEQGEYNGTSSCIFSRITNQWECTYTGNFQDKECETSCYPGSNCETMNS